MEEGGGVVVEEVEEAGERVVAEGAGESGGVGEDGVETLRGEHQLQKSDGNSRGETGFTCTVQRASCFVKARFEASQRPAGDAGGEGELVEAEVEFSASLFQESGEVEKVDSFIR